MPLRIAKSFGSIVLVIAGMVSIAPNASAQDVPVPVFTTRLDVSTAIDFPTFIKISDINSDGLVDIVAQGTGGAICILFNEGGIIPSFELVQVATVAGALRNFDIADTDNDGDLDIISCGSTGTFTGEIWLHENVGKSPPLFQTSVIGMGGTFFDVDIADFNGDGYLDVVAASRSDDSVRCFHQNATSIGQFDEFVITDEYASARSVEAADFDNDGHVDVIVGGFQFVQLFTNPNGDGIQFVRHDLFSSSSASGAMEVSLVDFNRDGEPDIITTWTGDDSIRLHKNLGSDPPSVETVTIGEADEPAFAVSADLNNDGLADVVSVSSADDSVRYWRNLGSNPPTFDQEVISSSANMARWIDLGDLDSDGDLDVIAVSAFDDAIRWHRNDSDLTARHVFRPSVIANGVSGTSGSGSGVFTNSGRHDIVVLDGQNGVVRLFRNLGGDPPTWAGQSIPSGLFFPGEIFNDDFDGDGFLDIILTDIFGTILLCRHLGSDPPRFEVLDLTTPELSSSIVVADLNRDGDIDFLSRDTENSHFVWMHNDGESPPSFMPVHLFTYSGTVALTGAGDVDGDGDIDLAGFRSLSGSQSQVLWWENLGTNPVQPAFKEHVALMVAGPRRTRIHDLDQDGDGDLIIVYLDGELAWLEYTGSPIEPFDKHRINSGAGVQASDFVQTIECVDFDADGDLDIITTHSYADGIRLHENIGGSPPQFITHIVTTLPYGGRGIGIADFNGDDQLDIAAADSDLGEPQWFENLYLIPNDLNDDGVVNGTDLAQLLAAWGLDGEFGADLNGDGLVNGTDLATLLANWTH